MKTFLRERKGAIMGSHSTHYPTTNMCLSLITILHGPRMLGNFFWAVLFRGKERATRGKYTTRISNFIECVSFTVWWPRTAFGSQAGEKVDTDQRREDGIREHVHMRMISVKIYRTLSWSECIFVWYAKTGVVIRFPAGFSFRLRALIVRWLPMWIFMQLLKIIACQTQKRLVEILAAHKEPLDWNVWQSIYLRVGAPSGVCGAWNNTR